MDAFGQLPLTISAFEARLRRGEVFSIQREGEDGFSYALWFQEERFLLRQGGQLHPFREVQPAVLTLLNCMGEFSRSGAGRGENEQRG